VDRDVACGLRIEVDGERRLRPTFAGLAADGADVDPALSSSVLVRPMLLGVMAL
jgi:hypothetical protein